MKNKKRLAALLCAASMTLTTISMTAAPAAMLTGCAASTDVSDIRIDGKLSNPNADEHTQKVYKYICNNFGKNILSCQQESTWMGTPDYEMDYIEKTTGKLPAMRGLDFMNDDFDGVVSRAKQWDAKGGLVTICWHTGVYGKGYTESLGDDPDFDKLLTEGTEEYEGMMASWDKAAKALSELNDAGVTVLWRPFHEFDGQWFWWGKGGADKFKKLWQLMYDKFTNEYELDNLIWVLGYSGEVKNGWYPGDEYCDIIGSDTYDSSTNRRAWQKLAQMDTGKPLAFHECGNVPSVDKFKSDGAMWSWFMIWHTDHIMGNNKENLKSVYNSDSVITLDEIDLDALVADPPAIPQITTFTSTDSAIRVNWEKADGADGYNIYRSRGGADSLIASVKGGDTLTYRDSGLIAGTQYLYRVEAYADSGSSKVTSKKSGTLYTSTKPQKVTLTTATKTNNAVRINWKKVTCSGYKIQQYDSKTKKWKTIKLISADKTTYRISKLKSNTSYKFRVQAFKRVGSGKTYSAWSASKTVKTRK